MSASSRHLLARPDAVIYDSGAHNSIITGARLSGAKTFTYPNGEWDGLDALLEKERAGFRRGLIVAEGVYSMDGQILDLKRAGGNQEAPRPAADGGRSPQLRHRRARPAAASAKRAGMPVDSIDVYMGTLSKTLASSGGYIAGDRGPDRIYALTCAPA